MKKCTGCNELKDLSCFGKSKTRTDGLWCYCKQCTNERARLYRHKNREKVKESSRLSRINNPEKVAETKRKYREKNSEKCKIARKIAYDKNRERELEKAREYKRKNPHVNRELSASREARKKMATPSWFDLSRVRELHRLAVEAKKATGIVWHVDHIVPLKSDLVCGLHWHGNMQLLPASVNQSKSNRHWPGMF